MPSKHICEISDVFSVCNCAGRLPLETTAKNVKVLCMGEVIDGSEALFKHSMVQRQELNVLCSVMEVKWNVQYSSEVTGI
ncbi:hypothetical protein Pmani_039710 [Petrolisthes manimaculis]|uniref:Uncharacterized protein n=1 Tax=Petrolisthes manimaculis TaxID=1843537 RepID=A0AAE1NCD0_9EUCA|nr:hypothetical protein Pmani_039710 [Petrolisthes manimaculis]